MWSTFYSCSPLENTIYTMKEYTQSSIKPIHFSLSYIKSSKFIWLVLAKIAGFFRKSNNVTDPFQAT